MLDALVDSRKTEPFQNRSDVEIASLHERCPRVELNVPKVDRKLTRRPQAKLR